MSPGELTKWPFLEKSVLLFNPRLSHETVQRYQAAFDQYLSIAKETHVLGLLTSGTTASRADDFKIIVLSRTAFESSAQSVNQWIHAESSDRWSLSLPRFHVGGVSILVRASLSESEVVAYGEKKWDPLIFHQHLTHEKITLVSLVPTQIFDIVKMKLSSPKDLRCVFVGGGELQPDLFIRACELGWPLILTFGMTEMASQVACSRLQSSGERKQDLFVLPHISANLNADKKLQLRSPSQLSAKIEMIEGHLNISTYEANDWFLTEDYAELHKSEVGMRLISLGRGADFVKIKGENVSLKKLRDIWSRQIADEVLNEQCYLFARPDLRDGHSICVAFSLGSGRFETLNEAQRKFNEQVLPFERIQRIVEVPEIPRNELGKVLVSQILKLMK